jgi:hypothetical protein
VRERGEGVGGGNVSKLAAEGSGTPIIQWPPSSGKMLEVCRRNIERKSYS